MIKNGLPPTIVLLLLGLSIHAQDTMHINPFTYGKKVTTIDDNFENLFRNVKQIVDNPDSIQFLGYDYVGIVQNVKDAKKYLSEDIYVGAETVGFSATDTRGISSGKNGQPVRSIKISLIPDIKDNQRSINNLVNKVATQINMGDKVYQIHFVLNHNKMDYNVFVNPRTKQVMTKYNLFLMPSLKPEPFNNMGQARNKTSTNQSLLLKDSKNPASVEENYKYSAFWTSWRKKGTWEEKLDAIVEGKFAEVLQNLSKGRLKLQGYEFLKDVNLMGALTATKLNQESLIAVSSRNNLYLMPFAFIQAPEKEYVKIKYSLLKRFMKIEYFYENKLRLSQVHLKLVKLNWMYRGNAFSTNCIVSPATQKIVYDNILSNISTTENVAYTTTKSPGHHSIHRKSCYVYTQELHTPKIESIYGVNQAVISFVATGIKTDSGTFKFTSVAESESAENKNPFYRADAEGFYKEKNDDKNQRYYHFSLKASYGLWTNSLTADSNGISTEGHAFMSEGTSGSISPSLAAFTNKCKTNS